MNEIKPRLTVRDFVKYQRLFHKHSSYLLASLSSLGLDMNKIEGVGGPGIKYSFPHKPEVEGSLKPFVSQNGVK